MKETIKIEGMTCNHCIQKVKKFVSECEGVDTDTINISLERKTLEINFNTPATLDAIKEAIEDAGYKTK